MVLVGTLDLFELMVNNLAGNIFLSLVIWAVILMVAGIMGRMSFQSILIILCSYFAVAMVGYIGALASVPIMIWAIWYMLSGIINAVNNMR